MSGIYVDSSEGQKHLGLHRQKHFQKAEGVIISCYPVLGRQYLDAATNLGAHIQQRC